MKQVSVDYNVHIEIHSALHNYMVRGHFDNEVIEMIKYGSDMR